MPASNFNYVCFRCRTVTRHPKLAATPPVCQNCDQELYNLGYKVAVPKRDNIKAWRELEAESRRRDIKHYESMEYSRVRRKHDLERELVSLRSKPQNKDRDRMIKTLEDRLSSYT